MTTFSVVIPAFNEEDGIKEVITRVLSIRPRLAGVGIDDLEVIVVDDGSVDGTARAAAEVPEVRLIRHAQNGGYGAALKTGFAAARGEWIGFLDADGTYPPERFPELCQAALAQDADIVIGSRMAGLASEMPAVRRLGNFLFANLVSLVSAQRITDSASGMRVFKHSILERIYPLPDGLNLTPVMSTRALHERLKMIEVPIPYRERVGRSKLSVVRDGTRFAQSIVWTALTYNPVRLLGLTGLAALGVTGIIGLWVVLQRLQGITTLGPGGVFAVFTAAVLGGIGNIPGAMLGGLVLGQLENFFGTYLPILTNGNFGTEYKDVFAFLTLVLLLLFEAVWEWWRILSGRKAPVLHESPYVRTQFAEGD